MNRLSPKGWETPAQIADGAPPAPPSPLVPLIIGCALFMQTLDSTVITNALPTMARSLHENPLTLNLAITSYLLASAVFLPISGWVADRFGAKQVFRVAIALFAFSSLLCGLSTNLPELVGARLLQGLAGAMMSPVGRLLLLKTVSKAELVRAMSYVTMPAMLGPVVGPLVGGVIVTYLPWGWIFFMNIPIAVIGITLVSLFVGDVREEARKPLDWRGFLLTGAGLAGVLFGFENLGRGILPPWAIAGLFVVGGACLTVYVFYARRAAHPILDLSVLRIPTFAASTVGGSFFRLAMGATPFLLALLLQMGFGLSALTAGWMTFASAAGALAMKTTAGPILRAMGFRSVLIGNSLLSGVIFMGYALFRADTPHLLILVCLLVGGFFRSLNFTAFMALAFADIPQERMSNASTISSMAMPLAQSVGVGLAAVLLYAIQTLHGSTALRAADVSPAFVVIGLLSMLGLLYFVPMRHDAGASVSGASRT